MKKTIQLLLILLSTILFSTISYGQELNITDSYGRAVTITDSDFIRLHRLTTDYANRIKNSKPHRYAVEPKLSGNHQVGAVNSDSLAFALDYLNYIRQLSYLNHDIRLDPDWNRDAQHAAFVLALNGSLSHNPPKPPKVDQTLYQSGKLGASKSNIASGYSSISSTLSAYMNDHQANNIGSVGHRRWLQNPSMTQVGFGYVDGFSATKVIGPENKATGFKPAYVSWPAKGSFPLEFFTVPTGTTTVPWSVMLNPAQYDNQKLDKIEVLLENLNTKAQYRFTQQSTEHYFKIDTQYFVSPFCIIFRPSQIQYSEFDRYRVTVKNLYHRQQRAYADIEFTTDFFCLAHTDPAIAQNQNLYYAEVLRKAGLFKGTGQGYALAQSATRTEGLVMLLRLLGQEQAAQNTPANQCLFVDVPDWAKSYVAYAYKTGLTKGISADHFGANQPLTAQAFLTLLLRHTDLQENIDFTYQNAVEQALAHDWIDRPIYHSLKSGPFLRNDLIGLCYEYWHRTDSSTTH